MSNHSATCVHAALPGAGTCTVASGPPSARRAFEALKKGRLGSEQRARGVTRSAAQLQIQGQLPCCAATRHNRLSDSNAYTPTRFLCVAYPTYPRVPCFRSEERKPGDSSIAVVSLHTVFVIEAELPVRAGAWERPRKHHQHAHLLAVNLLENLLLFSHIFSSGQSLEFFLRGTDGRESSVSHSDMWVLTSSPSAVHRLFPSYCRLVSSSATVEPMTHGSFTRSEPNSRK
ncbi:unnamed protein product [Pleuronectes platessa]|uniref:Uncharacterized protein n=1 Tax=Pleuronectes platessa TaxID=8262 RepID=A0A9N7UJP4_PLEPL|nr:unnamed protein product [Pleuronectes platessa]